MLSNNDLISQYLALFWDSFNSTFILGLQNKLLLPTMLYFTSGNKFLVFFIDNIAVMSGYLANYLIGILLNKIFIETKKANDKEFLTQRFIGLSKQIAAHWGYFCLLLFLPPLDAVFVMLAGFIKFRVLRTLSIFFIANLISYITYIVT
ncbi:MAG: hypothetical protein K9G11_02040 [Rickettsiaceae bacterium]|nr:hypothetical protein [Rickettsiaceae bacterium]